MNVNLDNGLVEILEITVNSIHVSLLNGRMLIMHMNVITMNILSNVLAPSTEFKKYIGMVAITANITVHNVHVH